MYADKIPRIKVVNKLGSVHTKRPPLQTETAFYL
jgi:hypothetical protein